MRGRTKLVVAVQSTVTLALAWTAVAWTEERDLARSQYEAAYAEWLCVSEVLARQHRPDLEQRRLADEEAARGEAALVRHRELSATRDEVGRRVAAMDSYVAALCARQEALRREAEVPLDADLRAREIATRTRAEAMAFHDRAKSNALDVEEDLSTAEERLRWLRALQAFHRVEIKRYEACLEAARRRDVPIEKIAEWGRHTLYRRLSGRVLAVDAEGSCITIDLGKGDAVVEGRGFSVYRGDQFMCRAVVSTANEDDATLRVLPMTMIPGRPPRPGDRFDNYDWR